MDNYKIKKVIITLKTKQVGAENKVGLFSSFNTGFFYCVFSDIGYPCLHFLALLERN